MSLVAVNIELFWEELPLAKIPPLKLPSVALTLEAKLISPVKKFPCIKGVVFIFACCTINWLAVVFVLPASYPRAKTLSPVLDLSAL